MRKVLQAMLIDIDDVSDVMILRKRVQALVFVVLIFSAHNIA